MPRSPDLRDRPVTTGNLVAQRNGINVHCSCGHHGSVTTNHLAKCPDMQVYDFKCGLRCSRCGRSGVATDVEIRIRLEDPPFAALVRARTRGTPPQLPSR